jgi:hypothetical protein
MWGVILGMSITPLIVTQAVTLTVMALRGGRKQETDCIIGLIKIKDWLHRGRLPCQPEHPGMRRVTQQFQKLPAFLAAKGWFWKVGIAGLCGIVTHTLLMLGKAKLSILESFQPYQSLQIALSYWTGEYVHPLVPWLISYINGSTAAGFAFANLYPHLPGSSGLVKGFMAGVLGWLVMNLIFFPLGLFATHLGLGMWPSLFSLGMMLAYSVVMGIVYGMMDVGLK